MPDGCHVTAPSAPPPLRKLHSDLLKDEPEHPRAHYPRCMLFKALPETFCEVKSVSQQQAWRSCRGSAGRGS